MVTAAELYDVRTREIVFDFPALDALIPSGSHVLEVGSGTGRVVRHLRQKNCSVVAVEIIPDAVAILKERFGEDASVTIVQSDFRDLQLASRLSQRVDIVLFSFDVFSEFLSVDNRIDALHQASRLLNDGGRIILFNSIITRPEELNREAKFEFTIKDQPRSYRCTIVCMRSAVEGVSSCAVTYEPLDGEYSNVIKDQFARALITRNELLTLLVLHPAVEIVSECDARNISAVTPRTDMLVHVLQKRLS